MTHHHHHHRHCHSLVALLHPTSPSSPTQHNTNPPSPKTSLGPSIRPFVNQSINMSEDEPVYPCERCSNDITTTAVPSGGKRYHLECFLCYSCGNAMSTRRHFNGPDGKPYCNQKCSVTAPAGPPLCGACNKVIEELDNCMQAVNKKFHEKCFKCTECRINVARTVFYESRGVVYCEVCYRTIITNIFRGK
jgi:hypothetical protein